MVDVPRLVKLFTQPRTYWNEVLSEPGDIKSLLIPQMLILAAVPTLLASLGLMFRFIWLFGFGRAVAGFFVSLLLTYVMQLAFWILFGVIINALAGPFGAQKDFEASMKLATGGTIACWAGSVLALIPVGGLAVLGMFAGLGYAVYVLYLGFPIVSGAPESKAIGYAFAVVGIMLAIGITLGFLSGCPAGCAAALH